MKYSILTFVFATTLLISCKKEEEPETTSTNTTPSNITPTSVEVSVTMNGTTYDAAFGSLGTSMQFESSTNSWSFDSLSLTPSTSLTLVGLTNEITYANITLPSAIVSNDDWDANPEQAFIDYFSGLHPYGVPNAGSLFFILNDGSSWTATNETNTSGSWVMNHVVESSTGDALVRCQGQITINLTNAATMTTQNATVSYVIKFQEPF